MKLAEYCNTSTGYIGEIEIGKKFPSIEMIQKMATVLEIEPYKLFVSEENNSVHIISPAAKGELLSKLNELIETVKNCDMG